MKYLLLCLGFLLLPLEVSAGNRTSYFVYYIIDGDTCEGYGNKIISLSKSGRIRDTQQIRDIEEKLKDSQQILNLLNPDKEISGCTLKSVRIKSFTPLP